MPQVLITGGSSGIGFELAKKFAADGYELLLAASNPDRLFKAKQEIEAAYDVKITIYALDLSKQGAAEQL